MDDKALIAAVKLRVAGEHPSHLKRVNVDAYAGAEVRGGPVWHVSEAAAAALLR